MTTCSPSGLRTTQHGLLAQIEVMGSPALGELAEIMVMDASALSHTATAAHAASSCP